MSETLRDLVVSLSLNSDNFTRNIKSITKQIQEAQSEFRLASAGVSNFENSTAELTAKLNTLQRTFELQQNAVNQYERALEAARNKLQECYNRQGDYANRLAAAKQKQADAAKTVASAMAAYQNYKTTLGETNSATIAAKQNMEAAKAEYTAASDEVKKLERQEAALTKATQNAADAVSTANVKYNDAQATLRILEQEIWRTMHGTITRHCPRRRTSATPPQRAS